MSTGSRIVRVKNASWIFPQLTPHLLAMIYLPRSTMTAPSGIPWTFTSPSVYLALDKIYTTDGCSGTGRVLRDQIVTLHPDQLSSYVFADYTSKIDSTMLGELKGVYYSTRSFNLADLEGPVPAAAYGGTFNEKVCSDLGDINSCHQKPLADPIDGAYNPIVPLPQSVRSLDPVFENCFPFSIPKYYSSFKDQPQEKGVWDPPIALTPTAALAQVTVIPAKVTSEMQQEAMPGSLMSADPPAKTQPPAAIVTIGQATLAASNLPGFDSAVVLGSQTLRMNGPAATIGGQEVVLKSEGLVVGTTTIPLPRVGVPEAATPPAPGAMPVVYRIGGEAVTAYSQTGSTGSTNPGANGGTGHGSNSNGGSGNNGNSLGGNNIGEAIMNGLNNPPSGNNPNTKKPTLVIGTATLEAGGSPVVYHGQTLSLGSDGMLSQGNSAVQVITGTAQSSLPTGISGGYKSGGDDDNPSSYRISTEGLGSGRASATLASGKKNSGSSSRIENCSWRWIRYCFPGLLIAILL
jgi:hypothetical protein